MKRMTILRHILPLLVLFLSHGLQAVAQQTMRQVLTSMPDSIVPYLTQNNLLDCIDFKDAKMEAKVRNTFGGTSELLTLNDSYALFNLNEAHRMELSLLDVTHSVDSCQQILCMIDTYGTDAQESTITFYSLRWHRQPTATYVSLPATPFTASIDEKTKVLTITGSLYLDRPAIEGQPSSKFIQIKLNWTENLYK